MQETTSVSGLGAKSDPTSETQSAKHAASADEKVAPADKLVAEKSDKVTEADGVTPKTEEVVAPKPASGEYFLLFSVPDSRGAIFPKCSVAKKSCTKFGFNNNM